MNIARIDNGTVINIEVATEEWLDAQEDRSIFVPYTDEAPARIGDTWDGHAFIPPAAPEAPNA